MPLKAYKKLGYNTKKIKKFCNDKKESYLGTLYKVNLETQSKNTIEQDIREAIAAKILDERSAAVKAKALKLATPKSSRGSNAEEKAKQERQWKTDAVHVLKKASLTLLELKRIIKDLVAKLLPKLQLDTATVDTTKLVLIEKAA